MMKRTKWVALLMSVMLMLPLAGASILAEDIVSDAVVTPVADEINTTLATNDVVEESPTVEAPAALPSPAVLPETEAPSDEKVEDEVPAPVEYTVTFADAQGLVLSTVQVLENGTLESLPTVPELEGYTAEGWSNVKTPETLFTLATPITENTELRPLYAEIPEEIAEETIPAEETGSEEATGETTPKCCVTYLDADGNVLLTSTLDLGTVLTDPLLTPEKEGCCFEGWYNADDVLSLVPFGTPVEGDLVLAPLFSTLEPEQDDSVSGIDGVTASLSVTFASGDVLRIGDTVTLKAILQNLPEDMLAHVQWQNDASGSFADVEGATGLSHTFTADAVNTGCQWRVAVTLEPLA